MADWRRWMAIGTGVGVEIRENDLDITIVRVRPSGVAVIGSATVTDYRTRPAAEWGSEVSSFLRKVGAGHVAATVLLPRREVIVRHLDMPGVADNDLAAAVQFQLDGLHPFTEDEILHSFARAKGTQTVLVGIARRETVERFAALFAEAGIKIAAFTFSAAAVYSAIRVAGGAAEHREFVALHESPVGLELYGESVAFPVYSVSFDVANSRAVAQAIAELRLAPESVPMTLAQVLPLPRVFPENHDPNGPDFASHALPYATAVSGACPWLGLPLNLLPEAFRKSSSRARYIPTIVLASLLALLVGAILLQSRFADRRYLNLLEGETRRLQPKANLAGQIDKKITLVRARTFELDEFRRRSRKDLDVLNELTKLLAEPGWVSSLELTRTGLRLGGETAAAADLLKLLDSSPYFKDTEFTTGIARTPTGEGFQLRANREDAPAQTQQQAAQAQADQLAVPQIIPQPGSQFVMSR